MQSWKIFSSLISFCLTIIYRYIYMYTCITSIVFLLYLLTNSVFLLARWCTFHFLSTSYHYLSPVYNFECWQHGPLPGVWSDRGHCGVSHRVPPVDSHNCRWSHSFHEVSQKTERYEKSFFNRLSYYILCINTVIGKKLIFIWIIFWYLHRIHWVFRLYL